MGKEIFVSVCILIFCVAASASMVSGQKKLVEIPKDYGAISVLSQPAAPVFFEEVQLFTDMRGSFPQVRYVLRNRTTKDVILVSVEFHQKSRVKLWVPHSDSWIETTGKSDKRITVVPAGGRYENLRKDNIQMALFSKELADVIDTNKGGPRLLTYWVGFVARVVFSDGTEYKTSNLSEGLTELLFCEN